MNPLPRCIAVLACLGLACVGARAEGDFRLLRLGGFTMKWGEPSLGVGARVTYALAARAGEIAGSRNCPDLRPVEEFTHLSGIGRAALERELEAALSAWQSAANIRFERADDQADADIVIGVQGRPTGRAFADVTPRSPQPDDLRTFTAGGAPGRRGAQVAPIARSLVCLNPDGGWKLGFDGDLQIYDLRYTLIHELGHAIGLDHPGASGELMSFRYLEEFTTLQSGDIAGVVRLYGPPQEASR